MATTTAAKAGNPKAATDLNLAPSPSEDISSTQQLPAPLTGGGDDDGKNGALAPADVKTSDVDGGGAATDIQKKMKRAERFGMPVHLSEEEKRSSRAERFGTVSAVGGLDSSKHSEDLKRKARAERFGIVRSVSADEEAKKKARLARFGTAPAPATDSAEEDKKKARALRFSEPKSSPNANGDGKIETKTVISGKAGGGT